MQISLLELFPGIILSVVVWTLQLTVAALWNAGTISIFVAFLVALASPPPETSWGLLASGPRCGQTAVSYNTALGWSGHCREIVAADP
jgi:hypothetical protein